MFYEYEHIENVVPSFAGLAERFGAVDVDSRIGKRSDYPPEF